jgi:hypothetical protein
MKIWRLKKSKNGRWKEQNRKVNFIQTFHHYLWAALSRHRWLHRYQMVTRWYKSNLIWELVARKEWWKTFRLAIDSKIIIWILQTLNKKTLVSYRTKELRKYWIHLNSMRRQDSENRESDKTQGSNRFQESPPETEGKLI